MILRRLLLWFYFSLDIFLKALLNLKFSIFTYIITSKTNLILHDINFLSQYIIFKYKRIIDETFFFQTFGKPLILKKQISLNFFNNHQLTFTIILATADASISSKYNFTMFFSVVLMRQVGQQLPFWKKNHQSYD